ncbi:MAG: Ig-like domain-containing protein [Bacilli bacterium]|jgi:uncharacterized protein YjdB
MKKWIAFLLALTLMFVFIGCDKPVEEDPDDPDDPVVEDVLPTAIAITNGVATMNVGDTQTLTIEITPSTTTNKSVTWKSSNEAVVKVDSAGGLTALAAGTATITVTSKAKSSIKATLEVTVNAVQVDVASVTVTGNTEVEVGKTITLMAAVLPSGANSEVTFTTSDAAIATVDANGKVTGVAEGTVTITATSKENTAIKDDHVITVKAASTEDPDDPVIMPTSIIVDGLSSVTVGYPTRYTASVYPEGVDQSVTWHSRKEEVATIDSKGVLTGVAEGTTYIYAISTIDPSVQSDYFKVSVKPDESETITYPDLQGYVISMMNASSELETTNPFTDSYTASDKMAKQKAWTDVETLYNCKLSITAYPDSAPWGAERYNWINAQAAAGTPQADFYVVSAEWLPIFVNGGAAHETTEFFDRYGRGQIETFQRQVGTYKQKLYIATTGISDTDIYVIDGLYYNYGMIKKYNLQSPAEIFMNGDWTYTRYVEWCLNAQSLLPENNWVMSGAPQLMWAGMVQAGGVKLADHISLKLNLTHKYSLDAVKALQNVMSGGAWDRAIDYDQKVASFQEGRAIFQPGEYWFVMASNHWPANLWGEGNTEYGYVPFPRPDGIAVEKTYINGVGDSVHMMAEGRETGYPAGVTYEGVYRAVIDMFINTTLNQKKDPTFDAEAIKRQSLEAKLDDQNSIEAMLFYTAERVLFDPIFDGFKLNYSGAPASTIMSSVLNNTDVSQEIATIIDQLNADFIVTYG